MISSLFLCLQRQSLGKLTPPHCPYFGARGPVGGGGGGTTVGGAVGGVVVGGVGGVVVGGGGEVPPPVPMVVVSVPLSI